MWKKASSPNWDVNKTIEACEIADANLNKRNLNPAPKFREARMKRDARYIRQWVLGCHLLWLNPR